MKYEIKDDTATILKKRKKLSEEYTEPYFQRFIDNYEHYLLRVIDKDIEQNPDSYPFYSRVMLPMSYQVVETILPRMFARMFSFNIETDEENDRHDEFALENLIKYQMYHPYLVDDPFMARMVVAMKESFITGNAWFRTPWIKQVRKVQEWWPHSPELGIPPSGDFDGVLAVCKEMGIEPQWKLVTTDKTVFDAPLFQHRSIFQIYPDPKKKHAGSLGWIIDEEMMNMDELMQMINSAPQDFKNIDGLKKLYDAKDQVERGGGKTDFQQQLADIFGSDDYSTKDDTQHQFKVSTMVEADKLCLVVNEKLTIREGVNPNGDGKLGYGLIKDIPVPHELYAWGEPDPIKKLEDGMTDQFNMRSDDVFYDLMRMWKVDPTALVEGIDGFIPDPGAIIEIKSGKMNGSIEPVAKTPTPASSYREYGEWEKVIQGTSGVTEYATGENSPGMNPTLGGVERLQQAANSRFALKLQLLEDLALTAVGTQYVQRNVRYFDTPQPVSTRQGKMIVKPESVRRLRGPIRFKVAAGSTEAQNMDKEWARWKAVADMAGDQNNPIFANLVPESYDSIALGLLNALRVPNADDIIRRQQPQNASVDPLTGLPRVPASGLNPDGSQMTPEQMADIEAQGAVDEPQADVPTDNLPPEPTV